ncbi:MAG: endopeptidase La [Desulfobacterales bacterium]|nr:MAG: endopeptidase La [Desulfobacterales bacterium]
MVSFMQPQENTRRLSEIPEDLPILSLRNTVAFPFMMLPLSVGVPRSVRLIEDALKGGHLIGLLASKDGSIDEPVPGQIYEIGTVAKVHHVVRNHEEHMHIVVEGIERFRVKHWLGTEPYLRAHIALCPDIVEPGVDLDALMHSVRDLAKQIIVLLPNLPQEVGSFLDHVEEPRYLFYMVAANARLKMKTTQQILEIDHLKDKYEVLISHLMREKKDRIIEYLAVRKLVREREEEFKHEKDVVNNQAMGAILCFVGPPGVGKTSLGQSIARALGRKFTRMSLGGMRDEAEIRGHRRTYIGAMPGRIIQAVKRAGTRNPVFMLDEVDKIGTDWRGDPSSALLEVLDPAQNHAFRDHYLDFDFDLSDVMFITTANQLETIPPPLRDRMETIHLEGYTEHEKIHIVKNFLVVRQLKVNGLRKEEVIFADDALRKIIQNYTREVGVRTLERQIGTVCRKVVVKIASGESIHEEITPTAVREYLKKEKFESEASEIIEVPGIATGLAVTATGGDILFIEATRMAGKGSLTLTGQLGDVMRESAQIAHSYVRSKTAQLGINSEDFEKNDVHLHVPAGAIPKDGPSAGIAMVTAIASLFSGKPVRGDVGMTGEVTLRGRVLPVGGIKMKILAAHRAGLTTVILPQKNEVDLEELPEEVRSTVNFMPVERIDEALFFALTSYEKENKKDTEK